MTPRLEACYFDEPDGGRFARMARVLAYTAAQQCATWQRSVVAIQPAPRRSAIGNRNHERNTQKLEHWVELVLAARDGARLLLMDSDTAILRPLDDIWDLVDDTGDVPFDLAFARKRRGFPCNLGVLFVRVSEPVRMFFRGWREENARLLEDADGSQAWRLRFGGINQSAFGLLRERGALEALAVRELSCVEWNCEESSWAKYSPAVTRILHVKGALRRSIFRRDPEVPEAEPLMAVWRDLERAATRTEVPA